MNEIGQSGAYHHKKALLRDHKRCTACRVAYTMFSLGGGGATHILTGGTPIRSGDPLDSTMDRTRGTPKHDKGTLWTRPWTGLEGTIRTGQGVPAYAIGGITWIEPETGPWAGPGRPPDRTRDKTSDRTMDWTKGYPLANKQRNWKHYLSVVLRTLAVIKTAAPVISRMDHCLKWKDYFERWREISLQ